MTLSNQRQKTDCFIFIFPFKRLLLSSIVIILQATLHLLHHAMQSIPRQQHLPDLFGEANKLSCSHRLHESFRFVFDVVIVGSLI